MSRQIIAKYGPFIFRCCSFPIKNEQHLYIYFADFFELSDEVFIEYYKRLYPNHSLQIYKHPKKHLVKKVRLLIEDQIKHPYFTFLNRDFNLKKIFE